MNATINIKAKQDELLHIDNYADLPISFFEADFLKGNSFWSPAYFKMIAETCDEDFEQHWLLHKNNEGNLIAAASFQVFNFSAKNYQFEFTCPTWRDILPQIGNLFLKYLIRPFSLKILLQGNAFTTGNLGIANNQGEISKEEWIKKVEDWQWDVFLKKRKDIGAILWKDFNKNELADYKYLESNDYLKFEVQPTMILNLDKDWSTFEDYLGAMQSKYRTRMRKAFKKGESVESKWMTVDEIKSNIDKLEDLYQQVVEPSNFKMTCLPVKHLWKLTESEQAEFKVLGFYAPEGLVGFITFYNKNNALYAGYMGIDRETQFNYDQYLRTLLELIKAGIEQNFDSVYFGRTALEIKSSTGAEPERLFLFAKHRDSLVNIILRSMVQRLSKQAEWNQRHPFK